jgi:hypothetical protein
VGLPLVAESVVCHSAVLMGVRVGEEQRVQRW